MLDTVRQAVRREKKKVAAELQLHSDQGFQYTSQAVSYTHLDVYKRQAVACQGYVNDILGRVLFHLEVPLSALVVKQRARALLCGDVYKRQV